MSQVNVQHNDADSIEISSNFLSELKLKARKATHGPWHGSYDPQDNMIEGKYCEWVMGLDENERCPFIENPLLDEEDVDYMASLCKARVSIKEEDLSFICAANPAVVLALISKIEELQSQNNRLLKRLEDREGK